VELVARVFNLRVDSVLGGEMQEITIMTENKVGALAEICELLGGCGVNIESITAYGTDRHGVVRVITKDSRSAESVLLKAGKKFNSGEVVVVKISDRPGELGKLARKIAQKGIDVESIYLMSKGSGFGEFAIKTANAAAAEKALK
jgi:hypothetical protein